MRTPLIVPLAEATQIADVGGKARNLARLIRLGVRVPDGFVVTDAALSLFISEHRLDAVLTAKGASLDARSPFAVRAAAETIASAFRDCTLPSALAADLDDVQSRLGFERLIVRSSAAGEDSEAASFAGQLDSIANVTSAAGLRRAIVDVWVSRWSARALTYQLARKVSLTGMGVIVQHQVDAAISGVLFSAAPGDAGHMLVEYCGGSGEALVGGRINPGRLTIARGTGRWVSEARPDPSPPHADLLLNDRQIDQLQHAALEIERHFGSAQDIEWTIDGDGQLWIVQSRPITVQQSTVGNNSALGNRPWTSRNRQSATGNRQSLVVWSNANVNENFPAPISPLLYSIARTGYYHYFRNLGLAFGFSRQRIAAMEKPLRQIIGVQGARMYYNLTNIHSLLRSAPFGDRLAHWFNQFTGADATATPGCVPLTSWRSRAGQWAELARIAACTAWQYAFVTRRVERFEATVDEFAERTHPLKLRDRSADELLDDIHAFLDIRYHRWVGASLADAASMACYGALEQWLRREFPTEDQGALHNSLLKALPNLPSGQPALKLWELSRLVLANRDLLDLIGTRSSEDALTAIRTDTRFAEFHSAFESFLEAWGFRCSGELMLTVPSFQEQPERALELLKTYVGIDGDSPADQLKRQAERRLEETARVASHLRGRRLLTGLPFVHQWHLVAILLGWTQRSIVRRERARLKQALLYSRLRRIGLALGERLVGAGRLSAADDIFHLTVEEIDAWISGSAMFPDVRELIALRRRAHAQLGRVPPPDTMALPYGDYWTLAHESTSGSKPGAASAPSHEMTGLGVCGGTATARAAILTDVSDAHLLQAGDVLVTRQTDPGWGAIFPLISGLVMERGGMLSHGAIIAREFGIPTVVGVANATGRVPHGSRVTVDGDRGLVRVADPGVGQVHAVERVRRCS